MDENEQKLIDLGNVYPATASSKLVNFQLWFVDPFGILSILFLS